MLWVVPILVFLAGCDATSDALTDVDEVSKSDVVEPAEWSRMVALRIEGLQLLSDAMKRGVAKEEVMASIRAGYEDGADDKTSGDRISAIMFDNEANAQAYAREIRNARTDFLERFPNLTGPDSAESASCSSEAALSNDRLEAFVNLVASGGPEGGWEALPQQLGIAMPGTPNFLFCEWQYICIFCDRSVDWVKNCVETPGEDSK